ncbi:MAG: DUF3179 domain-containing protein [Gammaproteobacteria bacterium]|nr:DUF3179 domain-containing protein [Gammaproteobacteria bacterium]
MHLVDFKVTRKAGRRGVALLCLGLSHAALPAVITNGFDLTDTLIPVDQIHHGGPPRDGIPAIDNPQFLAVKQAVSLADTDRVLGVRQNGVAKAYPIRILNYHEIVNDKFGSDGVVVSYCPLCGTGMAFSADIDGRTRSFGVSGLLYNSDVLFYDRETESLWSQILTKAVSGSMRGTKLKLLATTHTTWRDWRTRHPDTVVLSEATGHRRDYSRTPYVGYETSDQVYFPVSNVNRKYHPKELVIGLTVQDQHKVYPFAELSKAASPIDDQFAGREFRIEFDASNRSGRVLDAEGMEVPTVIAYWFAWVGFHPETEIFEPRE